MKKFMIALGVACVVVLAWVGINHGLHGKHGSLDASKIHMDSQDEQDDVEVIESNIEHSTSNVQSAFTIISPYSLI